MARLVVTGASPLIGPAVVKGLPWLPALFGEVWMPEALRAEVLPGRGLRGEAEIADALAAGALRVWSAPVPQPLLPDLDDGEAACIRIGLQHRGEALLLMDERAGRVVAHQSGLSVAGTAAVIGMAKARNLIAKARPIFEALHQSNFRSSARSASRRSRACRRRLTRDNSPSWTAARWEDRAGRIRRSVALADRLRRAGGAAH